MNNFHIRPAVVSEKKALEALQLRAALNNPADLANPDAIDLPIDQIEAGRVFVLEKNGAIVGFSAVLPREDGDAELDGLFVDPAFWRQGLDVCLSIIVPRSHASKDCRLCMLSVIPTQRDFIWPAVSS
jgi:hypothetical protein